MNYVYSNYSNDEESLIMKLHISEYFSHFRLERLAVHWRYPYRSSPKDLATAYNTFSQTASMEPDWYSMCVCVCESGVNDKTEGTKQIVLQTVVVISHSGHGTTRCRVFLRGKSNACFVLPCIPSSLTFVTPLLSSRKSQCKTCKEISHPEIHLCSQTLPTSSFSITINRSVDSMGAWGYCKGNGHSFVYTFRLTLP